MFILGKFSYFLGYKKEPQAQKEPLTEVFKNFFEKRKFVETAFGKKISFSDGSLCFKVNSQDDFLKEIWAERATDGDCEKKESEDSYRPLFVPSSSKSKDGVTVLGDSNWLSQSVLEGVLPGVLENSKNIYLVEDGVKFINSTAELVNRKCSYEELILSLLGFEKAKGRLLRNCREDEGRIESVNEGCGRATSKAQWALGKKVSLEALKVSAVVGAIFFINHQLKKR